MNSNFSLLEGASRSYLGGRLGSDSQATCTLSAWGRGWELVFISSSGILPFLINARLVSRSFLYPGTIQKYRGQPPAQPPQQPHRMVFVSKSKVHGELIHRNQRSISSRVIFAKYNYSDSSQFKINICISKDKEVRISTWV